MGRLGNNLAGHYKRGVGMALQIGIGNFGGAIASNIYRTQDAPRYVLGRAYLFLLVFFFNNAVIIFVTSRVFKSIDQFLCIIITIAFISTLLTSPLDCPICLI